MSARHRPKPQPRDLTIRTVADLARLIPSHMRHASEFDRVHPLYALNAPDYDRMPIDTFLVSTQMGTAGRVAVRVLRVVKPNDPTKYQAKFLTKEKRLLFVCWRGGMAVKSLEEPKRESYRHIVLPDDPRHEMVAAFKIACDTRRAFANRPMSMKPDLLYRALGVETLPDSVMAGSRMDIAR